MKEGMVSVIVPVYNAEQYLKRCISSLLNQTYQNMELIIIDDGSTDASSQIYNEYKANTKVRIFQQDNKGVSAARNVGLDKSKGQYVAFIDADDYVEDDYLEILVEDIMHQNAQIAVSCIYEVYEQGEIRRTWGNYTNQKVRNLKEKRINFCKDIFAYSVWGKLFCRSSLEGCYFDETLKIGEDSLFMGQVLKNVDFISFTDRTYYYYFMNLQSVMHEKYSNKMLDELKAWKQIQNLYLEDSAICNTCKFRYLNTCRRVATVMYFSDATDREIMRKYRREIIQNQGLIWRTEASFTDKIKLLIFAYIPELHFWLFAKKGAKSL